MAATRKVAFRSTAAVTSSGCVVISGTGFPLLATKLMRCSEPVLGLNLSSFTQALRFEARTGYRRDRPARPPARRDRRRTDARRSGRRVQHANPVVHEIGEEVFADVFLRELKIRRVIERATGDRPSLAMVVGVQRPLEPRIGARPFGLRPTVVGTRHALVDLFPTGLSDVVDQDAAGARLHRKSKRVSQPISPDGPILVLRGLEERIVVGDRAVGVDPQQFSLKRVDRLGR